MHLDADYDTTYSSPWDSYNDPTVPAETNRRNPSAEYFASSSLSASTPWLEPGKSVTASFMFARGGLESGEFRFISVQNSLGQELFRVAPVYQNGPTRIEYGNGQAFTMDVATIGWYGRQGMNEIREYTFILDLWAGTFDLLIDSNQAGRDFTQTGFAFLSTASPWDVNSIMFGGTTEIGGQIWELDDVLIQATFIPEPSVAMLLALPAIALLRRRR
jgi:hypothetical protein